MAFVQELLQSFDFNQGYENVTYEDVTTTDFYRKSRPYKLLQKPGKSTVTLTFGLSDAENVSSIILQLNHCRTTADGIVNVALDGTTFIPNLRAPRDDFGKETFRLQADNLRPQGNELTIQLDSSSPGVYWLSDAEICIERQVDQKGNLSLTMYVNSYSFIIKSYKQKMKVGKFSGFDLPLLTHLTQNLSNKLACHTLPFTLV